MKKIVFLVGLFLTAVFFFGCNDDDSGDGDWVNKSEELYKHNRKKISVEVGVYGTLLLKEGNCMPIAGGGKTTCKSYPVKRNIRIYEPTTSEQTEI